MNCVKSAEMDERSNPIDYSAARRSISEIACTACAMSLYQQRGSMTESRTRCGALLGEQTAADGRKIGTTARHGGTTKPRGLRRPNVLTSSPGAR
jgi:hypothetical protein